MRGRGGDPHFRCATHRTVGMRPPPYTPRLLSSTCLRSPVCHQQSHLISADCLREWRAASRPRLSLLTSSSVLPRSRRSTRRAAHPLAVCFTRTLRAPLYSIPYANPPPAPPALCSFAIYCRPPRRSDYAPYAKIRRRPKFPAHVVDPSRRKRRPGAPPPGLPAGNHGA